MELVDNLLLMCGEDDTFIKLLKIFSPYFFLFAKIIRRIDLILCVS